MDPQLVDVPFPLGGLDVAGEFGVQRPGTTAVGKNVRASDPILERNRGGSRHGLLRYPTQQIPEGSQLIQHLNQIVILDADYLLGVFEDWTPDFVPDPTVGAGRNPGRDIPPTGSGSTPNRNRPLNPRRRVGLVASNSTPADGDTITLTATVIKRTVDTAVAGVTVTLFTIPPGRNGDGSTAVTNVSGEATFSVTEASFEGDIVYIAANEYTVP